MCMNLAHCMVDPVQHTLNVHNFPYPWTLFFFGPHMENRLCLFAISGRANYINHPSAYFSWPTMKR
ncbi:hypothetical protein I7I53_10352 [Histoplasma capsulatum var. duboisii H88]|uniref:Uncharacterized protein n=1 Tax=Ajellomyces capsulatus (strain H88) TaxID=544711 RepID=A0A8A1LAM5_AJEC8|nr:hypothetical protein I7I53_10352 [Histoplasma capsulatum var. duboisii H88]